jgi:hypothetical protein
MKLVTLRDLVTGRVFDRDATRVAMDVPDGWPANADVLVTADDLEWVRPDGETTVRRSVTRRLEQFFAGERCAIPSRRVSADGRTLWSTVEVVTAVHLGNPPEED